MLRCRPSPGLASRPQRTSPIHPTVCRTKRFLDLYDERFGRALRNAGSLMSIDCLGDIFRSSSPLPTTVRDLRGAPPGGRARLAPKMPPTTLGARHDLDRCQRPPRVSHPTAPPSRRLRPVSDGRTRAPLSAATGASTCRRARCDPLSRCVAPPLSLIADPAVRPKVANATVQVSSAHPHPRASEFRRLPPARWRAMT